MMPETKNTYVVVTSNAEHIEVQATHAVEDETAHVLRLFDGESLVGVFRQPSAFYLAPVYLAAPSP